MYLYGDRLSLSLQEMYDKLIHINNYIFINDY